jgi:hypothetical protein
LLGFKAVREPVLRRDASMAHQRVCVPRL